MPQSECQYLLACGAMTTGHERAVSTDCAVRLWHKCATPHSGTTWRFSVDFRQVAHALDTHALDTHALDTHGPAGLDSVIGMSNALFWCSCQIGTTLGEHP